jgi:hypothetical protein
MEPQPGPTSTQSSTSRTTPCTPRLRWRSPPLSSRTAASVARPGAGNGGNGTTTGGYTTLDNDGNAVFIFEGISCAPGPSTVVGDLVEGTHDTYSTIFTITAPEPTVA